jgi:molecular chaperone GrpE
MEENTCPGCCEGKEELYLNQLKELQADFINFKNRVQREKEEIRNQTKEEILKKFLEVKDNFERIPEMNEGIKIIYCQLTKVFTDENIQEMNCEYFDPLTQEAIATNKELEKDKVQVVEKGYIMNDQVLRTAKVIVGTMEETK